MDTGAIRGQVERAFRDLSEGKLENHLRRFSNDAVLRVHGPNIPEGAYTGIEEIRAGLTRLYSAVPHHQYRLNDVWIDGASEDIHVAVAWTDHARTADGQTLEARGMNRIRLGPNGVMEEDVYIAPDEAQSIARRASPSPRRALRSIAVGALAAGALAVGALAIGALAIGRLRVGKARLGELEIGKLRVGRSRTIE